MRIISGKYKGTVLRPPKGLPVRPTTDMAKESLFNILSNLCTFENLTVLDLFSGTGNIAFEFISRGAEKVDAVDKDGGCISYIRSESQKLGINNLSVVRKDVFSFLNSCSEKYDIIFADAPYNLSKIIEIPSLVFSRNLLQEGGMLILEHVSHLDFSDELSYFDKRVYGQSAFTFFKPVHPQQTST